MDSCLASFRSGISSSIRLWRCHAVSGSSVARCWALSSRMRCPSAFAASSYWAPISRSVMVPSSVHLYEVLLFLTEEAVHGLDMPDSRPALHLGRRNEPPAVRTPEQANLGRVLGFPSWFHTEPPVRYPFKAFRRAPWLVSFSWRAASTFSSTVSRQMRCITMTLSF